MEQSISWELLTNLAIRSRDLVKPSTVIDSILERRNHVVFVRDTYNGKLSSGYPVLRGDTGSFQPVVLVDPVMTLDMQNYYSSWVVISDDKFNFELDLLNEPKPNSEPTIKEEEVMSTTTNRRTVRVELIDNDPGLDVKHSLVAFYNNVITEDDDATTIQELMMHKDIAGKLAKHNQVRTSQVDQDVLKRTGNTVNLQPVKLKNLTWVIK